MPSGVYIRKLGRKLSEETKLKISKSQKGLRIGRIPWNKGKQCSKETKEKMRLSQKNNLLNNFWLGKKMSIETRKKMSLSSINRKHTTSMKGDKHYNWKGGVTKDKKYRSWMKNKRNRLKGATIKELGTHTFGEWELLKKQYNYTCPCCKLSEPFNQRSKNLTEDHIIPLSKGGSDLIENIQPLCLSCNIKKHTRIIKF